MTGADPRAAASAPFWASAAATPVARPPRGQFPPLSGSVVLATIGAGALGALLLPGNALGVGVAATAVAILGAAESARTRPVTPWSAALDLAAAALAATAVLSDAGWVLVFT
ncbi:MAG TPA: hypothetical protein VGV67_11575, partial [Solirubrobacteraceae bacterium]|nr:hypothetical protein [Solirubrobacteraceae bacterium]